MVVSTVGQMPVSVLDLGSNMDEMSRSVEKPVCKSHHKAFITRFCAKEDHNKG